MCVWNVCVCVRTSVCVRMCCVCVTRFDDRSRVVTRIESDMMIILWFLSDNMKLIDGKKGNVRNMHEFE